MYPLQAREWVFPTDSESGHLAETKEDRSELSKWGNDLRQTFRTIATAAGVSEIDAKLLMNHSIPGVNAGYITRHKRLQDHLRRQQQAISSTAIAALGTSLADKRINHLSGERRIGFAGHPVVHSLAPNRLDADDPGAGADENKLRDAPAWARREFLRGNAAYGVPNHAEPFKAQRIGERFDSARQANRPREFRQPGLAPRE
jgi:hypothetical protein